MGLTFKKNNNIKAVSHFKSSSFKVDSHPSTSKNLRKLTAKSKNILQTLGYRLNKNA